MSHSKERSEKKCLNCGADLYGRYCHLCGQENIEPKESAWHLVTHFFYDITHFDGKFFTTLKDLLLKPGFLSREYMSGRRSSYLHPIRMYVFTSAFFFIVFFSLFNPKDWNLNRHVHVNTADLNKAKHEALVNVTTKEDSANIENAFSKLNAVPNVNIVTPRDDSTGVFGNPAYARVEIYDSIQKTLPAEARDGWFTRLFRHKEIYLNNRYRGNRSQFIKDWIEAFMHNFPKLLFISLPIFAFLLQLLYIRRRKQFYYVDHGIFAIHLYIYSFIALLISFAINYIARLSGWSWLWIINLAIFFFSLFYFYKAMRNFYRQGRFKTFLKYCILWFLSFIVSLTLFMIFFFFSVLEI